jgi:hypothetical protein
MQAQIHVHAMIIIRVKKVGLVLTATSFQLQISEPKNVLEGIDFSRGT